VPFFGSFLGKQKRTIKKQVAIISFTSIWKWPSFFLIKIGNRNKGWKKNQDEMMLLVRRPTTA